MHLRTPRALALAAGLALLTLTAPAHALKVATWNLWQYPTSLLSTRQPNMIVVMRGLDPDVIMVQELLSQAGRDSFLTVLRNANPDRVWKASSYISATESAFFWDSLKVDIQSVGSFGDGGPRQVLQGLVKPLGYATNPAWFRLYSIHLKAGTTATDINTRAVESTNIRITLNNVNTAAAGTNFLIGGDSNIYTANESAYTKLVESQADNDGRSKDFLLMPGQWNKNSGYALYHTQCPCNLNCLSGFSGGGMDDRFDFILSSYSAQDGQGLDIVPFTGYVTYGNDGQHYNQDIDAGGFNNAVGMTIATALRLSSDHIPVAVILQLPSIVVANSAVDFGSVIVGATAQQPLSVANGAVAPADALTYSLAAPAGFTAPAGTFNANAGAAANAHTLGMDTATRGARAGTLVMSTDAPDSLTKNVLLSGTVLSHAVSSLDSATVVTEDSLDLGEHLAGEFVDGDVRVLNQAYDALQARLQVTAANVSGGEGRFTLVGGFTPALIGALGRTWSVHFDDAGATPDSVYEATLTFDCADEALPGAQPASGLVVHLRARPTSASTGVGAAHALRFESARPNPFSGGTHFAFELPRDQAASLAIFDLSGRRIATLAEGTFGAGRHDIRWDGRDASGARVQAGLYFAHFDTPGLKRNTRIVLLP